MSDHVQIQLGSPPWSPAPGTRLVEVVSEYDMPLLAVIEQDGTQYMARCLLGEMGTGNLWIYCRLDGHEAVVLREGTADQIDELIEYLTDGTVTVSLAEDGKIEYSAVVNISGDSWTEKIRSVTNRVIESLERVRTGADEMNQTAVGRRW